MLRYLTVQAGPLIEDYSRHMITGDEYNLHPNAMLVPHELLPDHEVVPLRETPEASFPQSFGFSEPMW